MGEAFSDKEVAFSHCRVIPRLGEDFSFIKLSEWLNAVAEHSESAHHHSVTGRTGRRKGGGKRAGNKGKMTCGIGGEINTGNELGVEKSKTHLHD